MMELHACPGVCYGDVSSIINSNKLCLCRKEIQKKKNILKIYRIQSGAEKDDKRTS